MNESAMRGVLQGGVAALALACPSAPSLAGPDASGDARFVAAQVATVECADREYLAEVKAALESMALFQRRGISVVKLYGARDSEQVKAQREFAASMLAGDPDKPPPAPLPSRSCEATALTNAGDWRVLYFLDLVEGEPIVRVRADPPP